MALQPLVIRSDKNGQNLFALSVPGYVLSKLLAASTAEAFTVPAGANYVVFSATGDFYADYDGAASVPGDVTDGTAAELNPSVRYIGPQAGFPDGVTSISIISAGTPTVTAAFYS